MLFIFYPAPQFISWDNSNLVPNGGSISMSGSGWEPEETITITPAIELWPSTGTPLYDVSQFLPLPGAAFTVTTGADGSFAIRTVIPPEPPETQVTYFANANGPRLGQVTQPIDEIFSVYPTDQPTLKLNRKSALAGGSVTLTGENWPVGQNIRIIYCWTDVATDCAPGVGDYLTMARSDSAGRLNVTVKIPADASPGTYVIRAAPDQSPFDASVYSRTALFTILYPFAQAHPRLEMAIRASPFAASALIIGLIALAEWLRKRRRASSAA
jgi:hypothetical protein